MNFDFSIWIALLAIYLLQFLLSKKKPGNQRAPDPVLDESEPPASLQDALSEISRMLGGEPPPQPQPVPPSTPRMEPKRTLKAKPQAEAPIRKDIYFDDVLERKDYKSFHAPEIKHPKKNVILEAPIQKVPRPTIKQDVKKDIHVRTKAQEALVLAELLGPPLSIQPRRKGR